MAAFALATWVGCSPSGENLSDGQKQERIDEMVRDYVDEFPGVPQLDAAQVADRLKTDDAVLVDVRTPEERNVSVIPGAISREDYEAHKKEYEGRPVIAYCTIGYRSSEFVEKLREEGCDASNFAGSILAWVHAGQPIEDPLGHETKRVHTYGRQWALVPQGYEAVY